MLFEEEKRAILTSRLAYKNMLSMPLSTPSLGAVTSCIHVITMKLPGNQQRLYPLCFSYIKENRCNMDIARPASPSFQSYA